MARMKSLTAKVETDEQYKPPHRIYDIEPKASKASPQELEVAAKCKGGSAGSSWRKETEDCDDVRSTDVR
jgi:hypothetical protein